MKKISLISLMLFLIMFNGCIGTEPQRQLTTEEIELQEQFKSQLMAQLKQGMQTKTMQTTVKQEEIDTRITTSYITNDELQKQFSAFPKSPTGVKFTNLKDGFSINDTQRYIDHEGKLVNFGYNWENANVTYLIETSPNRYKIKFTRALSGHDAIDIANVYKSGKKYMITTVTGKKITSSGLILTSTGFIALRDESAFVYEIGKDIYNFYAPTGWHIAQFQNGDVSSTKYILLEKTQEQVSTKKGSNPLFDFFEATKELGALVGLTDKQDYMLINLYDTNKKYLFDITLGSKDVALYSECKKTSHYIAKCDSVDFYEALYERNGLPNTGHYYWTILWFSTQDGPIAATREKVQTKVVLTDLISGKKVEAAFRLTGFPELSSEQNKNGKVKITVGGGMLSNVVIEDANEFLKTHNNI